MSNTDHGPASRATATPAAPTYARQACARFSVVLVGVASERGRAASAKIAFEYLRAEAAPNNAPASAERDTAACSASKSSKRPASMSGARSGSRKEVPTIGQNTPVAAPSAV